MGGHGSGRWYRWDTRTTIEKAKRIDVRYLKRQGMLQPGYWGSLSWTSNGQPSGWIQVRSCSNRLVLTYRYRVNDGDWQDITETVWLDWTPCHYGGQRPWFRCPRCQRRIAVLCGGGARFLCRHCYNLPYASHQRAWHDRARDQQWKIRERLGATTNLFERLGPWDKPKGMHWRTFLRLLAKEQRYARRSWAYLEQMLGTLHGSSAWRNNP